MMAPVTTAYVELWGDTVGAVAWEDGQRCAEFEFTRDFLKKGLDVSPIHMGLDLARRAPRFSFPGIDPLTFHGLPGLLASSLPDRFGNSLIDAWLRRHGRNPHSFSSVERLCYIGSRCMGALEYVPQLSSKRLDRSMEIDVAELMALVQEVLVERSGLDVRISDGSGDKEKAEAMLNILRVGTSAGGAVPKAVIALNDEGHIISGQSDVPRGYDHWILKFDGIAEENPERFGASFEDCRVEYAYYLMAREAGIDMMESRLLEESGRAHFMTKRFDRIGNEKVHVLSLACMAHLGWNPAGTAGYEDAFYVMRELRLSYPEQDQQFRRMVFNAVARNTDDHTKNISYMMDQDGIWTLAPAYDVTLSFDSTELLGDRHKMTINGKQTDFTVDDFVAVARNMGINKPDQIIRQVADAVHQWPGFAAMAGLSPKTIEYIGGLHLDMGRSRSAPGSLS